VLAVGYARQGRESESHEMAAKAMAAGLPPLVTHDE